MTWVTTAHCNICDEQKRDTNNWFEVHVDASGELMIGPMSGAAKSADVEHICGHECLHRRLDQWMAAQTTTTQTEGADNHGSSTQS